LRGVARLCLYAGCEDKTLIPKILTAFLLPIVGLFWALVLWMFWTIAKSLKGIDETLKEIARGLQNKS